MPNPQVSYYYQNNERILKQRAEYYAANKETVLERSSKYFTKYYEKNKPTLSKKSKAYKSALPKEDKKKYMRSFTHVVTFFTTRCPSKI